MVDSKLKDFLLSKGFKVETESENTLGMTGRRPAVYVEVDAIEKSIAVNFKCLFKSDGSRNPIEVTTDISNYLLWEGIDRMCCYGVDWVSDNGEVQLVDGREWRAVTMSAPTEDFLVSDNKLDGYSYDTYTGISLDYFVSGLDWMTTKMRLSIDNQCYYVIVRDNYKGMSLSASEDLSDYTTSCWIKHWYSAPFMTRFEKITGRKDFDIILLEQSDEIPHCAKPLREFPIDEVCTYSGADAVKYLVNHVGLYKNLSKNAGFREGYYQKLKDYLPEPSDEWKELAAKLDSYRDSPITEGYLILDKAPSSRTDIVTNKSMGELGFSNYSVFKKKIMSYHDKVCKQFPDLTKIMYDVSEEAAIAYLKGMVK